MNATHVGTIRIKTKNLQAYEKTKSGWKRVSKSFPELLNVVKLFKANHNFPSLIDKKDKTFLKGQLYKGQPQGARINILPNGKVLDKAYSLFAPHLTIHDQSSNEHWDVIYQNKGSEYAYCYTLEKRRQHTKEKYKKVELFEKCYSKLRTNVKKALKDEKDNLALPLWTLLKTYMRVGNEMYYHVHGHKGLTTLKKKDIHIKGKEVNFAYIGKDGVPLSLTHTFEKEYISRLQKLLKTKKPDNFVFTSESTRHPIPEQEFKKAFVKYTGKEFYPHIVRSHYATKQVKEFLKHRKKASKEEVNTLFLSIAHDLGHRRFQKKTHTWQENSTVTVHHYIDPSLVERVQKLQRN
ncbi:hypothetical protein EXS74_00310 [Candidatus Woesearchaeota archaeon]|nr:hypothetical protein [Candidatus Woesearchaeota archaeon]